jgi:Mrp family chromosome partitioning ATPase
MSRIADALLKAGQRELDVFDRFEGIPPAWNLDEVHALVEQHQATRGHRPTAHVPSRQSAPELVGLVRRVFGSPGGETGARAVTFAGVGVGRADSRRGVAIDVAHTLAGQGAGSVCVVDADSGMALHEYADVSATPGLREALAANAPAVSVAVPFGQQVWLVPAGDGTPVTSMPSAVVMQALSELAANFDYLIVQAPALMNPSSIGTMLSLAPVTDGVVLMLDTERTRRDVAGEIVARLRANGVALLGAVVSA